MEEEMVHEMEMAEKESQEREEKEKGKKGPNCVIDSVILL
jgi:hypothetical protein